MKLLIWLMKNYTFSKIHYNFTYLKGNFILHVYVLVLSNGYLDKYLALGSYCLIHRSLTVSLTPRDIWEGYEDAEASGPGRIIQGTYVDSWAQFHVKHTTLPTSSFNANWITLRLLLSCPRPSLLSTRESPLPSEPWLPIIWLCIHFLLCLVPRGGESVTFSGYTPHQPQPQVSQELLMLSLRVQVCLSCSTAQGCVCPSVY